LSDIFLQIDGSIEEVADEALEETQRSRDKNEPKKDQDRNSYMSEDYYQESEISYGAVDYEK
jgi:hypothetical protein